MKLIKISEIAQVNAGQSAPKNSSDFSEAGIPFIRAGSLESLLDGKDECDLELISEATAKKYRLKLFPKDSIIFAKSGMSATKDRIYKLKSNCYVVSHLCVLQPKKVYPDYLLYVLRVFKPSSLINDLAYPSIGIENIENFKIPISESYEEQIRIADVFSRAESLIAKRKETIRMLDEYLKSTFIEMFGDPVRNEKWPVVEIADLAKKEKGSMRTGPFGSNLLHSEFKEAGEVAVLGIDNAVNNKFVWKEKRYITLKKYENLKAYTIRPLDVIITIMGTVGRTAVIPENIPLSINTKHLAAISFDPQKANPYFIAYSIHSNPHIILQLFSVKRGAIMHGLNLGIIKKVKIKCPPIELQNKFAKILQKNENMKSKCENNQIIMKVFSDSMSQQMFK